MEEEENNIPVIYTLANKEKKEKSMNELKIIKQKKSDLKFYCWDFKENYTYITYLKNFREFFDSFKARKESKVFHHISKLITTRSPVQIKSHHQKMMNRHKNIDNIFEYLRIQIIKYIRNHPQCAKSIQLINKQCEEFFREESGKKNHVYSDSVLNQNKQGIIQSHGNQLVKVKMQENLEQKQACIQFEQLNLSEVGIKYQQVKIEECSGGIRVFQN